MFTSLIISLMALAVALGILIYIKTPAGKRWLKSLDD
jgi:hypothetical protein